MILYEFPFNESIRTMLRLEQLFDRMGTLIERDAAIDHHFALHTVFEVMDIASRADLKSDLLKELERHRAQLLAFRGNPAVSQDALTGTLSRVELARDALNTAPGKSGQALQANEWLMSVRSRIAIPGGTCEFDLPGYFAWQHLPPARRRADLQGWVACLVPLAQALGTLLALLRESGTSQKVLARGGQYQQRLPEGRGYQLLRLRMDDGSLVPEITGHRLLVSIRLMRADAEAKLRHAAEDAGFELTFCH